MTSRRHRRISAATDLDIPSDPTAAQPINVTIDAFVGAELLAFWRVLPAAATSVTTILAGSNEEIAAMLTISSPG